MNVHKVSDLTGVSVRTLHYYDSIGLLSPASRTEAGYRQYDEKSLERLYLILLYRELEFSLEDIRSLLDSPNFNVHGALEQQIAMLKEKRERLDAVIEFAEYWKKNKRYQMTFRVTDQKKMREYAKKAKEQWGNTEAYREFEEKTANVSEVQQQSYGNELMDLFREFGLMKDQSPAEPTVQAQVEKLQAFISAHYYTCTKQILSGLGQIYAAGGEMTENIDAAGGTGTAEFAAEAIRIYTRA